MLVLVTDVAEDHVQVLLCTEADPRWDAKMKRIEQFRTVKARAADLGLTIKPIG
jgi:hypothetical protein